MNKENLVSLFKEKCMRSAAVIGIGILSLCGNASGNDSRTLVNPASNETTFHQAPGPASYTDQEPVAAWWSGLKDESLTRLVEQAVAHNLDLQIAVTQLEKSRAYLTETGADRLPTIDSGASYARQRLSNEGISGPAAQRSVSLFNGGFDAFWELDLFGRVSARVDRARALNRQALADLRAMQVTVTAEVARVYIELRGAQYRLHIARRNAENQEKTLGITDQKSKAGQSTNLDVARATAQLESTRARLPALEASIARSIRRLSVLTGQLPHALEEDLEEMQPLPSVPMSVDIGDPATLIRRRPDIQRAEEAAAAALAGYNIAASELYPQISFRGALGFTATTFGQWFSAGALRGTAEPTLEWRLFDLTRVVSQMKQSDQDARASVKRYEKTVLEALEEIENALTDFSKEQERMASLKLAERSSTEASHLAHMRFEAGLDNFLDLLDTERTQLLSDDALAVSETATALQLIAIYKALGGGWQFEAKADIA
ncbi:MAG: TolC family protein [Candidatus Omnitrophica bacterium]|jgi:multidrug efflux system outer membrane protein|nr:TolC family protein [Candidatus Omnitrophota bacterium]